MKKTVSLFVSLLLLNISWLMGMEPKREDFLSTLLSESIEKRDQMVLSEVHQLPNKRAMTMLELTVGRHKVEVQNGTRNSFSWREVRNDLEKVRQANLESQKQSAKKLCTAGVYYTVFLGAFDWMGRLSGYKSDSIGTLTNMTALACLLNNTIRTIDAALLWKSLKNLQRHNDLNAKILEYSRAMPRSHVNQLMDTFLLSGESLTREEYNRIHAQLHQCAHSEGDFAGVIKLDEVERVFVPSYSLDSMSNNQRNKHAATYFLGSIPFFIMALTHDMPSDSPTLMRNVYWGGHAAINMHLGLSILNGEFAGGDFETQKSLNDIIQVIDKHVSKKAD